MAVETRDPHDLPPLRALVVLGTRPEAIKLYPVIRTLEGDPRFAVTVVATGQHREMLRQVLEPFGIEPDIDLDIMRPGQTLNEIVGRVVPPLDALYADRSPDVVIVQGDTTTTFCAALAAFHRRVKVAHVEAGLRSRDRFHPYPEEANRCMTSVLTDLHLAPTPRAADNLAGEGIPRDRIHVTGNTAVDSLVLALGLPDDRCVPEGALPEPRGRLVLITVHRRESWTPPASDGRGASGALPLDRIFEGIRSTALERPDCGFVYPVHRNPRVGEAAQRILGGVRNIRLIPPVPYIPFVRLMAGATAIVTDSGGIQEEAPSLGVPVLVVRETTERPEALQGGGNTLVGTRAEDIRRKLVEIIDSPLPAPGPLPRPNPYGDGRAAARCRDALLHFFGRVPRPADFGAKETSKG